MSGGLGQHMGGLDLRVRELIEAPRRAHDRRLPYETGQRLWANPFGHEVLQAQNSPRLQEIQGTNSLGGFRCHRQ